MSGVWLRRRLVQGETGLEPLLQGGLQQALRDVRPAVADCSGMGREGMTTTLGRRVQALEAATDAGGGGGCDRCIGVLSTVHVTPSGEFSSAEWNGEAITEEEFAVRETETECPRCGRKIDPDEATVINIGGGPLPSL
jgi:hypothetical protein